MAKDYKKLYEKQRQDNILMAGENFNLYNELTGLKEDLEHVIGKRDYFSDIIDNNNKTIERLNNQLKVMADGAMISEAKRQMAREAIELIVKNIK